jgi:hypothetical protein
LIPFSGFRVAAFSVALLVTGCLSYAEPELPVEQLATIQGERDTNGDRGMVIAITSIDGHKVAEGLQRYRIEPGPHKIAIEYGGYGRRGTGELSVEARAGKAYVVHGGTQGYYLFRAWIEAYPQPGPPEP